MKKTIQYRQCGLKRQLTSESTSFQVSFIPSRFAKLHEVVRLKQVDGQWEDGWKVVTVGSGVDADHVPDSHRDIKAHRKKTGDSMTRPK